MNRTQRNCRKCNCELSIGTNWTKGRKKHRDYICKSCHNERIAAWRKANPERVKEINIKSEEKRIKTDGTRAIHNIVNRIYSKTPKGIISNKKSLAKRRQKLGFNLLYPNELVEQFEYHHINNIDVVAIPYDLHRLFFTGNDVKLHRNLLGQIVKQLYNRGR